MRNYSCQQDHLLIRVALTLGMKQASGLTDRTNEKSETKVFERVDETAETYLVRVLKPAETQVAIYHANRLLAFAHRGCKLHHRFKPLPLLTIAR